MTQHHRTQNVSWRALFKEGGAKRDVVVIRKHGYPLLILAGNPRFCIEALNLYPAQSFVARWGQTLLGLGLRLRLPLFHREVLSFDPKEPLGEMIAGGGPDHCFVIFCGNPQAPGQRFMILTGRPENRVVIKAGASETGRDLIRGEAAFLRQVQNRPCVPRLIGEIETEEVAAFITPYVIGNSPSVREMNGVATLLNTFILPRRPQAIGQIPAWKRLMEANPPGVKMWKQFQERLVSATLFHGDFAPWNIKSTPQGWIVLDWERGDVPGVPAWDWFHFFTQPLVLVSRRPPRQIARLLEQELASTRFQAYAERTGIVGVETELLLAYLEYVIFVVRPTEGIEALKDLARRFRKRC